MAKEPIDFESRLFKLVAKSSGAGYAVAEMLGDDELRSDEIKIRRWVTADGRFMGKTNIKRTQVIGDVLPGDVRLGAIKKHVEQTIAEFRKAQEAKAAIKVQAR